jgi:hypothetical protein
MELRFPVGLTFALSLASMWTRLSTAPTKVATRATQGLTSRGSRGRRGGARQPEAPGKTRPKPNAKKKAAAPDDVSSDGWFSADTDVDSDVGYSSSSSGGPKKPLAPVPEPGEKPGEEDDEVGVAKQPRLPAGTERIHDDLWFFMNKSSVYRDVRMSVKGHLSKTTLMGAWSQHKALTPHHYGDTWEDPRRTICLLKAWAVWRSTCGGWARARECRQRHLAKMTGDLAAEIRVLCAGDVSEPLWGYVKAERWLTNWVPDILVELRVRA